MKDKPPVILTRGQVYNLCRQGQELHSICCFVIQSENGPFCAKGTKHEPLIQKMLSDVRFGKDIKNNCSGPPDFIINRPIIKDNEDKSSWELWQEVYNRPDLIGGSFFEKNENGNTYYGPIKKIWINGPNAYIENEWTVVQKSRVGKWEKCENVICSIKIDDSYPWVNVDSSFSFQLKFIGTITIYPKGYYDISQP
ncbi:MAG: hypothetical protein WC666_01715 [Candidatus Paceibacterota bacterium]|jgi:hypothetical protein